MLVLDIDECEDRNGGCVQICNNTSGSYECSCFVDYVLAEDNFTCNGTYVSMEILTAFHVAIISKE